MGPCSSSILNFRGDHDGWMDACVRACVRGWMGEWMRMYPWRGNGNRRIGGLFAHSMLLALVIMYPLNSTDGGREERGDNCALEC